MGRANPVPQYPGFTRGPREQRRGSNAAMAASAASLVAVAGRPSHVSQAKLRSRPLSLVLNRAEDCRGPSAPRALPAEPLVAAAQMLSVNCVGDVSALDAGAAAAIQVAACGPRRVRHSQAPGTAVRSTNEQASTTVAKRVVLCRLSSARW